MSLSHDTNSHPKNPIGLNILSNSPNDNSSPQRALKNFQAGNLFSKHDACRSLHTRNNDNKSVIEKPSKNDTLDSKTQVTEKLFNTNAILPSDTSGPESLLSLYKLKKPKKLDKLKVRNCGTESLTETESNIKYTDSSSIPLSIQISESNKVSFLKKYMADLLLHIVIIQILIWTLSKSLKFENFHDKYPEIAWFMLVNSQLLLPSLCYIKKLLRFYPLNWFLFVWFSFSFGYFL